MECTHQLMAKAMVLAPRVSVLVLEGLMLVLIQSVIALEDLGFEWIPWVVLLQTLLELALT